jgi:hypothetical protein
VISIESKGSFKNTESYLARAKRADAFNVLNQYGAMGVRALAAATPMDTGLSAQSWTYSVEKRRGRYTIVWKNTNVVNGTPVVILIQYGHGTGTGGWVQGRDFINPAMRPVFDQIADAVWREVTKSV